MYPHVARSVHVWVDDAWFRAGHSKWALQQLGLVLCMKHRELPVRQGALCRPLRPDFTLPATSHRAARDPRIGGNS